MPLHSKPLGIEDESGFTFAQEMLAGDKTFGINFDRVQWDKTRGRYAIVEFLRCREEQFARGVTPHTSHPNRYWDLNAQKFVALWKIAQALGADLWLVNYCEKGLAHDDEVRVMFVTGVDPDASERDEAGKPNRVRTINKVMTRAEFSRWYRAFNRRGDV